MAYADFKNSLRRIACDKVLRPKAFNIAKNWKYDGYQRGIALMVYKVFDKRSAVMHGNNSASSNTLILKAKLFRTKN